MPDRWGQEFPNNPKTDGDYVLHACAWPKPWTHRPGFFGMKDKRDSKTSKANPNNPGPQIPKNPGFPKIPEIRKLQTFPKLQKFPYRTHVPGLWLDPRALEF